MPRSFLAEPSAAERLRVAREWLTSRSPSEELLIVAATQDAVSEILRATALASERGAVFGWHRVTLGRLAAELAGPRLLEEGRAPVGRLTVEAVVARAVQSVRESGGLGRYADVAETPGFIRAAANALEEIRLGAIEPRALGKAVAELQALLEAYERELDRAGLADRPLVLHVATATIRDPAYQHPLLGRPTLLLDVPIWTASEQSLVAALADRAPDLLATVPAGDTETATRLASIGLKPLATEATPPPSPLTRVQTYLFEEPTPPLGTLGDDVTVLSAPGEGRECVEIARRLLAAARTGVPFDRMAVLLRSPEEYRPHLEEALARAGIPAHFARGAVLPDPAGRAFLALIACALEGLSARRFAEYLSLGEVPTAAADGAPPPAAPSTERWVAPDEELVPEALVDALGAAAPEAADEGEATTAAGAPEPEPESVPVTGALRAPRRWEQLLVDAAVIGGRDRWQRRLSGLAQELQLDLEELDDPEGPEAHRIRRTLADLASLRDFALPILDALAALPERALWGPWIEALSALATRVLRQPERVLAVLSELVPMAAVGPVELREVQLVLSRRLLEIAVPPPKRRYGRVFVAPAEAARGLAFDVVCVPGLAEKLFPRDIREDPLLLDRQRRALGAGLATNAERLGRERLALRIAVGAATKQLVLSYPRLDLEKSRPRVPSFYALEALRAGEGRLPGFDELAGRAERVAETRVGWPAPRRPEDAIDEAEHDLALLDSLLRQDESEAVGTARYLLGANAHLGRALRFRARRWWPRWMTADGLVQPGASAAEALLPHRLSARSFSATALEHYAACPYRFFLQAIHHLAPREVPEAIDEMSPLQRGSLIHETQFQLFGELDAAGLLPVRAATLERVLAVLDGVLDRVAARFREDLAPAIERVWQDGVAGVRADLREWLRRTSEDDSGFVPWRYELAFGLPSRRKRDPRSQAAPAALDCGIQLRGSIDLVERDGASRLRVTDHKTGKVRFEPDEVVAGGTALQPVLYALAAEKLFPDMPVVEGRLSYCTATGGFEVRSVAVDDRSRQSAAVLAEAVQVAIQDGFLPALPAHRECEYCDYQVVCGPYEELRTKRKPKGPAALTALERLRGLP